MPHQLRVRHSRVAALLCAVLLAPVGVRAQQALPGAFVVVDQTGLPLPGVRIEVHRGDEILQSLVTGADGTFELTPGSLATERCCIRCRGLVS